MVELDIITAPIEDDLQAFKEIFASLLKSPVRLINIVASHMVRQRGKRIRPVLVLLTGRLCGNPSQDTFKAAALVEMLHNATLIHDDVVDSASVRRGGPTLNSVWKNKISVLMGDYILAKSLITAAEMKDIKVIDILSNASARMSQGEINQLVKNKQKEISEEDYFDIIGDKTAALISACCQLGAVSVNADEKNRERLKNFGEKIGLAFQIRDDLLDLIGIEKIFGKKKGADLKDGKITLPLIHALKQAGRFEKSRILKRVKKNPSSDDIRKITTFIKEKGGIEYAEKKALNLLEEAKAELNSFPDSEYKASLYNLSEYFVKRTK